MLGKEIQKGQEGDTIWREQVWKCNPESWETSKGSDPRARE